MKIKNKYFTLIELVVVISIISTLLGITLVSVNMAKSKAKFTKWLAYNTMLSKDPDTVINFNFIDTEARVPVNTVIGGKTVETMLPALLNTAVGAGVSGFELSKTHGIIKNGTWIRKGGRNRFHHALYFDGRRTYVQIPNSEAINFDPETGDFTIMMWVKFDSISSTRVLCGKAEWNSTAQYTLYLKAKRLEADVGRACLGWISPTLSTGKWYHIALVSEGGKFQIYLNGNPMTNMKKGSPSSKYQTESPLILGAVMTTANKTTPRYYFMGRMDEFILMRKSLKESEIKHHYQAGNYN